MLLILSIMLKDTFIQCCKKIAKLHIKWKIHIIAIILINLSAVFTLISSDVYRNLVWLFYYSFFSNSPLGWFTPLLPQEPGILLAAIEYNPLPIALVAGIATYFVELINYWLLIPICNLDRLKPFKEKCFYKILIDYYSRFPFLIIAFVALSPVPHLPFRMLAVLADYSVLKYGFATFLGRTIFYYILALGGEIVKELMDRFGIPYWIYIFVILLAVLIGFIRWLYRRFVVGKIGN